jgi:hypothetical protein
VGMDTKRVLAVLVAFLWCVGSARPAHACSCASAGPSTLDRSLRSGGPCTVFWQTSTVFVGRVESISASAASANGSVSQDREVRFRVLEHFRGTVNADVSVIAAGGICRIRFVQGRDYLVYASRDEETGRLTVSACSRTQPLENAAVDLSYARGAAAAAALSTHVSGTIAFEGRAGAVTPSMDGTAIVQDGAETRTAIDRQGRFDVEGLSAGTYQVRLDAPLAFYGQVWPSPITVPARGCIELRGWMRFNGRLRGRVTDHSGRPIAGLTVELAPRGGRRAMADHEHAVTGSDGIYELSRIPPGDYVLGVNMNRDADSQLPSAFYPGVFRLADARRVRLAGGQSLALGDFVLPRETRAVRLYGVVLDPDGSPAAGARVFLKGAPGIDYVVADPVTTDTYGQFVIAAFASGRYRLFAERDRGGSRLDSSDEIPIAAGDLLPMRVVLRRRY